MQLNIEHLAQQGAIVQAIRLAFLLQKEEMVLMEEPMQDVATLQGVKPLAGWCLGNIERFELEYLLIEELQGTTGEQLQGMSGEDVAGTLKIELRPRRGDVAIVLGESGLRRWLVA